MRFVDYLMLLDWTDREFRAGKPTHVRGVGADPGAARGHREGWFRLVKDFSRLFRRAAGTPISLAR